MTTTLFELMEVLTDVYEDDASIVGLVEFLLDHGKISFA